METIKLSKFAKHILLPKTEKAKEVLSTQAYSSFYNYIDTYITEGAIMYKKECESIGPVQIGK